MMHDGIKKKFLNYPRGYNVRVYGKCIEYLQSKNVLYSTYNCPICNIPTKLSVRKNSSDGVGFRCTN